MLSADKLRGMDDQDLVGRFKDSGDVSILGELYKRYMQLVFGVCLKYLKDREESRDAVMQIFEKLTHSLRDHEVTYFKSWLYVTARNHCLMALRSRKGKNFTEISQQLMESEAFSHLEDEPEMESNLSKLEDCIGKLAAEQKACVTLFYLQQKCYKEIVDSTGYDDNRVKSYIQNGKRNLKICMESHG